MSTPVVIVVAVPAKVAQFSLTSIMLELNKPNVYDVERQFLAIFTISSKSDGF